MLVIMSRRSGTGEEIARCPKGRDYRNKVRIILPSGGIYELRFGNDQVSRNFAFFPFLRRDYCDARTEDVDERP